MRTPPSNNAVPFAEFANPFIQLGDTIASAGEAFIRSVRGALAEARIERRKKKTAETLFGLSDQTLRDIGINRDEIPTVAERSAHEAASRVRVLYR